MELIDKSALVAEIENIKSIEFNEETSCDKHACMALDMVKDAIGTLEVKEVDLESEIDRIWDNTSDNFSEDGWKEFEAIAKHFFELGMAVNNKAQKGE